MVNHTTRCAVRIFSTTIGTGFHGVNSSPVTREMFREQFAGLLQSVDNAGRKFGFAKISGHCVCKLSPKFVAAFGVHGFIADDGKFVCARGYKN